MLKPIFKAVVLSRSPFNSKSSEEYIVQKCGENHIQILRCDFEDYDEPEYTPTSIAISKEHAIEMAIAILKELDPIKLENLKREKND